MPTSRQADRRLNLARLAARAVLACLSFAGCAAPLGHGLADYKSRKAIEQVAADDSFPTAAEVGLNAAAETSSASR